MSAHIHTAMETAREEERLFMPARMHRPTRTCIELHLCSYGIDPEAFQNGVVPLDVCVPLVLVWA